MISYKTPREIALMREAGRIVAEVHTWARESPDAWTAHLRANLFGEVQERRYRMERIGEAPR